MKAKSLILGALLTAAPLLSQAREWMEPHLAGGQFQWFLLAETRTEVHQRLGPPAMAAEFGDYRSWQYRFDEEIDHEDFSHAFVFRKSDGKLISVSRTYATERNVDGLFPAAQTMVARFSDSGKPPFNVRVRRLPGGRLLMAMGTSKPGQTTGQLVLILESELPHFYPWIEEQLAQK